MKQLVYNFGISRLILSVNQIKNYGNRNKKGEKT